MFNRFIKPVYAHCDVPCGIYETDTMMHAAATCRRMVEKYSELGTIDPQDPVKMNQAIRIVTTKEKHAQKCKQELYVLWSDYFKPEHLEKFPDLHEVFWKAAKQCGKVKQSMDTATCDELVDMVHAISHMFADSKK
ncbi:MAG TPA: superoxide dismutase, Ni [Candidatus Saccharibacteria bacterium]|jgi:nickel superoxide dismutase|nr:superoxide dismutase, Ni [Candidatus Saccharibacteria bacterium]HMT55825.1 superoxide dismutase, Ni [Candidatus Saccharibacteria bacterium]